MAVPYNPFKLLEPDETIENTFLYDKMGPAFGAFIGFGGSCAMNYFARRPIFSGIQKHVILTSAGLFIATHLQKRKEAYNAERDDIYRHYIHLHPEDFPIPERKRVGELLKPWVPVR
uniref:NADH dehydrogenase [ubiquinone] 1 subunit C2 n=1 Tax=Clastoptera arizonana TaxID=38151 RepID=A0A1B6DXD0_9HEMI